MSSRPVMVVSLLWLQFYQYMYPNKFTQNIFNCNAVFVKIVNALKLDDMINIYFGF